MDPITLAVIVVMNRALNQAVVAECLIVLILHARLRVSVSVLSTTERPFERLNVFPESEVCIQLNFSYAGRDICGESVGWITSRSPVRQKISTYLP